MKYFSSLSLTLLLASQSANAYGQSSPALPKAVAKRVCSNISEDRLSVSRDRLANAFLLENSILPDDLDFVSGTITQKLLTIDVGTQPTEPELLLDAVSRLRQSIGGFENVMRTDELSNILTYQGTLPVGSNWLFDDSRAGWTLKCVAPTEGTVTLVSLAAPAAGRRISIRNKPEELGIEGKARKQTGAFAIALEKAWEEKDDGTEEETTTLKVDGTIGLLLSDPKDETKAFAYAQYNLNRARKDPAPVLLPNQRRNENDTNVLALGLVADYYIDTESSDGGSGSLWLVGQGAYVFDFVDKSERIRLSSTLEPGLNLNLGICNLGSIRFAANSKVGARCIARLDSEVGVWTKNGISPTKTYDDFFALGLNGAYELFVSTGEKSEIAASVNYRYLPVITGGLNNIERFEAAIKHRFFTDDDIGFDLGLDYKVGTNELTLEEEESISLSFGIIY